MVDLTIRILPPSNEGKLAKFVFAETDLFDEPLAPSIAMTCDNADVNFGPLAPMRAMNYGNADVNLAHADANSHLTDHLNLDKTDLPNTDPLAPTRAMTTDTDFAATDLPNACPGVCVCVCAYVNMRVCVRVLCVHVCVVCGCALKR